jgi:uncharacterized protein with HEPN domain
MQHHSPQKYLHDMLSSCEFLLEFTSGRTVDDYRQDRAFRSAVERELQIIGEALMQLDDVRPDIAGQIPNHLNIIGFRHVLVHGYDALNPATVWNVIEAKLVSLKDQLQKILKDLPR